MAAIPPPSPHKRSSLEPTSSPSPKRTRIAQVALPTIKRLPSVLKELNFDNPYVTPAKKEGNLFQALRSYRLTGKPPEVHAKTWAVKFDTLQARKTPIEGDPLRHLEIAMEGTRYYLDQQARVSANLLNTYLSVGKYEDAASVCKKMECFPKLENPLYNLWLGIQKNNLSEILKYLPCDEERLLKNENFTRSLCAELILIRETIQLDHETQIILLNGIADMQTSFNHYSGLIDTLKALEELDPGSTLLAQGDCYLRLNDVDACLLVCQTAFERRFLHPQESTTVFTTACELRRLYVDLHHTDALDLTLSYFEWAATLSKDKPDAIFECIELYTKFLYLIGRDADAIKVLTPYVEQFPYFLLIHAHCSFHLQDSDTAIDLLKLALTKKNFITHDGGLLNRLSILLEEAHEPELAQAYEEWSL